MRGLGYLLLSFRPPLDGRNSFSQNLAVTRAIDILSREPFRERGVRVNKSSKKQLLIFKPKKLRNHAIRKA